MLSYSQIMKKSLTVLLFKQNKKQQISIYTLKSIKTKAMLYLSYLIILFTLK